MRLNTQGSPATSQTVSPGQHMLHGAVRVFLAEALFPLTGLITAAFLTRRLGAADYGLLTLAATLINWVEFFVTSLFARGTIKIIGDATDWRPVGAMILRMHLVVSVAVMLAIWALAQALAELLQAPALTGYLRLYALDIPLFAMATSHRNIMVGLGAYRQRAVSGGSRWITRLVLILVLVGMGMSVRGAIVAMLGASLTEVLISRFYVRPSFWGRHAVSTRTLWEYAVPLLLSALSLRMFRLDLFAVKALGGTAADAGFYGAAQNLAYLPALMGIAVSPLLLSTLTRVLREGNERHARHLARDVMRLVVLALPLWGMMAGASGEIVKLVFGARFAPTAPLASQLILASLSLTMISITSSILTAAGKPNLTFYLVGPIVPVAVAGHLLLVPRLGSIGASTVTTSCTMLGAFITVAAVYRLWKIAPPAASVLRSVLVSAVVYWLATIWPAAGLLIVLKLAAISVVVVAGYLILGEFDSREIALARSLLPFRARQLID